MSEDVTYGSYLKIDQLIDLQKPLSDGEHDEMLFIIIHQVYELWFKQMLHEGQRLQALLNKGDTFNSVSTLKRVLTILKTMVSQIDVLETMTPLSFASFRDRLGTSSGFQSVQFRQFEFFLGNKNARMMEMHRARPHDYQKLEELLNADSLYDSFFKYISSKGTVLPKEILNRDVTELPVPNTELQKVLVHLYKNEDEFKLIAEALVDLDEGVQEWRYRHVKMIERTIGFKQGSGGSAGAEYLKKTLFKPIFPDLWIVRAEF